MDYLEKVHGGLEQCVMKQPRPLYVYHVFILLTRVLGFIRVSQMSMM